MARHAEIVVLCEDKVHWSFVSRHLKKRGFNHRQFRSVVAPEGRGSGAAFVLREFARRVRAHRAKASFQLSRALVTVVDADVREVGERLRDFDQQLAAEGLDLRGEQELICLLVPKRNIETWICFLLGVDVDERTDYKRHPRAQEVKQAATVLQEQLREQFRRGCPLSLKLAWPELTERLPSR